jgi:hypothetical protein
MGRMRRALTSAIYISTLLAAVSLWPISLLATTYTVKSGGGGNYTTIQACSNTAVTGDTCIVYAGSYAGWTQTRSGSAGSPITFTVNPGDTVTVTGGITLANGISYINFGQISGGCAASGTTEASPFGNFVAGGCFTLSGASGITVGTTADHIIVSHNTLLGTSLIGRDATHQPSNCTISYNLIDSTGFTADMAIFPIWGNNNLIEYNFGGNTPGDFANLGGVNNVIRHNVFHDATTGPTLEHIDFVQVIGGISPTLSFSLIENNYEVHCFNDQGNCHFLQARASGGQIADTLIVRYNYVQNMDTSDGQIGDHNDGANTTPNGEMYNNTFAPGGKVAANGQCFAFDSGYGTFLNNICYNTTAAGWSPTVFNAGSAADGNIAYNTDCTTSCTWGSPYTKESTYAFFHNLNPLFANYPTDGSLSSVSPAIGAGVALTTASGAGTNSTSLTVADAHFFQPGWGPSNGPVQADTLRVGALVASPTAQISSINYSTNVITLTSAISWNNSDKVYLYKNSSGAIVLTGSNPDIGAHPYTGNSSQVSPPSALAAVVH